MHASVDSRGEVTFEESAVNQDGLVEGKDEVIKERASGITYPSRSGTAYPIQDKALPECLPNHIHHQLKLQSISS